MRVLTFTSLYPNKFEARLGIFVKGRMDHFDHIEDTYRNVIAPVQYFPLLGLLSGSRFHDYNHIPHQEQQGNTSVYHPRYMTIPGTNLIDVSNAMMKAADKILHNIYTETDTFDLIDGHYLYPDGVAAYKLAKKNGKPLVLTARGSDVNYWMEQEQPKKSILQAVNYAHKVICVSHALKECLIQHGVSKEKIIVIMNGVERSLFKASDKDRGKYLLSVGNLVPLKGHEYILRSLSELPEEKLIIIGSGELENHLKSLARQLDISHRVTFLPHVPQNELGPYYAGAKYTIMMSSMEGMPNVILESLATGTPVISTNVGGIAEVVTADNGILLSERTSEALTDALTTALNRDWDRQKISESMKYLDWHETARKLHDCFKSAL